MKKLITKILSAGMICSSLFTANFSAYAEDKAAVSEKSDLAIARASLYFPTLQSSIKGCFINGDGTYDVTFDAKDYASELDRTSVSLYIDPLTPFYLGGKGNVKLTIEEVWLDGIKYEGELAGKPVNGWKTHQPTDYCVITSLCDLKYTDSKGFDFKNTVRIVFNISGLTLPKLENGRYRGDVNGDNKIDAVDASLVLKHYADTSVGNSSSLNSEQAAAADINNDGLTDSNDASSILSYYSQTST